MHTYETPPTHQCRQQQQCALRQHHPTMDPHMHMPQHRVLHPCQIQTIHPVYQSSGPRTNMPTTSNIKTLHSNYWVHVHTWPIYHLSHWDETTQTQSTNQCHLSTRVDSPSTQRHNRWGSMQHTHKHPQRTEKPTYPHAIYQKIHKKNIHQIAVTHTSLI